MQQSHSDRKSKQLIIDTQKSFWVLSQRKALYSTL